MVLKASNGLTLVVVLSFLVLVAAARPSTAAASAIRECGNYGFLSPWQKQPHWTFKSLQGAGLFNLTTRRVGCRYARRFAQHYRGDARRYHRAWRCRTRIIGEELSDTRCTASRGRVIHWQAGA